MRTTANKQRRKKMQAFLLILIGGVMVLFRGTLTDYAHGMSVQDGIYIPNSNYHLSAEDAKEGVYSHTFRIYNLRPRLLTVEAQPDCGCTSVSWEKTTLLPFTWKDVTAQMRTNKSSSGSSVAVGFHSNSVRQPWLFAFLQS